MERGAFLTSLISFNVGVELGQLTILAACFALVGYCSVLKAGIASG